MASVILSVVGSDRPGLTGILAEAVLQAGGNWLESHLSRLGGLYVGSALVEIADDRIEALRAGVAAIDARGLEVRVIPAVEATQAAGETLELSLVGQDRPGIVRQVTSVVSGLDVNIEALATHVAPEPHSGAPIFHLDARLRLPPGLPAERVQAALEQISAEVMVDISVAPGAAA
ncbi:glycine cleavage system protein R [Phenylobacterium sp.]|uniref:glycine cleavage system protein R n=1 Tax=Phenylobacterium sp. TaxID=1871053 RepID=UPI002FE2CE2F